MLNNTRLPNDRYIAHVAIPCRNLQEAATWYTTVIRAEHAREYADRVTFSVGGVLQLVCHLDPDRVETHPSAYPRHFGLTLLNSVEFEVMQKHVEDCRQPFLVRPMVRFPLNAYEHRSFMIADQSGNVVEFKTYVDSNCCY